jgi:hypothetical protein
METMGAVRTLKLNSQATGDEGCGGSIQKDREQGVANREKFADLSSRCAALHEARELETGMREHPRKKKGRSEEQPFLFNVYCWLIIRLAKASPREDRRRCLARGFQA